jgi:hypothetical protein
VIVIIFVQFMFSHFDALFRFQERFFLNVYTIITTWV